MSNAIIIPDLLAFLKDLAKHNNREWFNENKMRYTKAHENIICFTDALISEMNRHDEIETLSGKQAMFRIYKDVRFSKDKSPYNTHWSAVLKRATKARRGSYYFHLKPGNCFLAGGFWGPEANDMKRIRQDIDYNYEQWRAMLSDKNLVKTFGSMQGEQVTSAPRGYTKDHPAIDLLRYKQFLLKRSFTDEEVLHPDFVKKVNTTFKAMRPFLDYMSEVLTTDANGISLI